MNTIPTNGDALLDTLLAAAPDQHIKDSRKAVEQWQKTTRHAFDTPAGRKWLKLALGRYNLMGSVFPASMCEKMAAFNDGRRSVISEILNAVAGAARAASPVDDDDEPDEKL